MRLYRNGSISNIVTFPQTAETYCLFTATSYSIKYEVSACVNPEGVNLYVTSFVSSQGFAFDPYSSKAE